jgi:hypothetical protein
MVAFVMPFQATKAVALMLYPVENMEVEPV